MTPEILISLQEYNQIFIGLFIASTGITLISLIVILIAMIRKRCLECRNFGLPLNEEGLCKICESLLSDPEYKSYISDTHVSTNTNNGEENSDG